MIFSYSGHESTDVWLPMLSESSSSWVCWWIGEKRERKKERKKERQRRKKERKKEKKERKKEIEKERYNTPKERIRRDKKSKH